MTLIREMIIVLSSNIPNWQEVLSQVIKATNFGKLDIMGSQIYYQPKSEVKNQNLSKAIDDIFLKNRLQSFLGCIFWDWSHISSKSSLSYFLSVLDECECFVKINLIKEFCSLIETLLEPHTPSLDDKMLLVINLIILLSNFL